MGMPGFSAHASLYRSRNHYRATRAAPPGSGSVVPQQLPVGLSPSDLAWCQLACAYCRYYGFGCFACWYCAIIISMGGLRSAA